MMTTRQQQRRDYPHKFAYSPLDGPAPVDEAPVAPEMARQPVGVDIRDIRPRGLQARWALHERAKAVVDQLAESVDGGRVSGLGHGRSAAGLTPAGLRLRGSRRSICCVRAPALQADRQ